MATPVEKAERRLTDIRAELTAARARLVPDLDFDAGFALRENIAMLERKEAAAADALAYARDQQAKAEAEAEKAAAAATLDAYRREAAREVPSLLNKYAKAAEAAATALAALDAHVKRADDMCELARQFGLPSVGDGEMLHRGTPHRVVPAEFEEREVWQDEEGNEAMVTREGPNGEALADDHRTLTKKRIRVEARTEQVFPAALPPSGRLADAVRLVDLAGRTIWPASR